MLYSYSKGQNQDLNNVIRLKGKIITGKLVVDFLQDCLCANVVPVFIAKCIDKAKVCHSSTRE